MKYHIFNDKEEIKNYCNTTPQPFLYGCVYILELSNNMIKIGKTTKLLNRYKELSSDYKKKDIEIYRIAVSDYCTNYSYLEELLHRAFTPFYFKNEINFETYNVSFDDAMNICLPAIEHFIKEIFNIQIN